MPVNAAMRVAAEAGTFVMGTLARKAAEAARATSAPPNRADVAQTPEMSAINRLQRTIGNQALQRMLQAQASIAKENAAASAPQEDATRTSPAPDDERNYEIALALSDFDPGDVKGYDDFKKRGSRYKPFKWYNYLYYEMPPKSFSGDDVLAAGDWVFANTATGKILQDKVLVDQNYKPTENELRQLAIESGSIVDEKNTRLDEGLGGNFDYLFEGRSVDVNVKVKFKFEADITAAEQLDFKRRFFDAVEMYWTHSGVGIDVSGDYPVTFVPIKITAVEVSSGEHKIVDVERDRSIPSVIDDMNLALDNDSQTIAHEFGHVLGLYDEYRSTGWRAIDNYAPWKRMENWKDTDALMNYGKKLRERYFTHFLKRAQSAAPKGVTFKIKMPK